MKNTQMTLTNAGLSILAAIQAGEGKISFTRLGFGKDFHEDFNTINTTDLKDALFYLPLESVEATDAEVQVSFYLNNKDFETTKHITEKGLFAQLVKGAESETEILFAYGNADEKIPPPTELVISRHENIILSLGQGLIDLTVEVSPGVTEKDFSLHTHNGSNTKKVDYNHLLNAPTALKADGGDADTVTDIAFRIQSDQLEFKGKEAAFWASVSPPIIKRTLFGVTSGRSGTRVGHEEVDLSKSLVLLHGSIYFSSSYSMPYIASRSATSFLIGSSSMQTTTQISWQLIEFY